MAVLASVHPPAVEPRAVAHVGGSVTTAQMRHVMVDLLVEVGAHLAVLAMVRPFKGHSVWLINDVAFLQCCNVTQSRSGKRLSVVSKDPATESEVCRKVLLWSSLPEDAYCGLGTGHGGR